jgi:hypothetical protein
MSCANSGITLFALIILVLTIWPALLSAVAVKWTIIVATVLIIITVSAGCECKWCKVPKAKKRR